jgi:membrane fusion protein (multidrug efflux system)
MSTLVERGTPFMNTEPARAETKRPAHEERPSPPASADVTGSRPSELPQTPPKKRSRARIVLPALIALAVAGAGTAYAIGYGKESTDDAQVEGHISGVSPRIAGQVLRVLVKDNQRVKPGDVLVELDDRDVLAKLSAARADLTAATAALHAAEAQVPVTEKAATSNLALAHGGIAQARAVEGTTRAGIEQARADIAAAESRQALAKLELDRTEKLVQSGALSPAELDSRRATAEQADAAVQQARARLASAQAGIANSSGTIESARARSIAAESGPEQVEVTKAQVEVARAHVEQAQAALEQALLNESYTKIRAEVGGVVARRSVEVGQLVSPDRPLMAIVPLDDTWVVANFKETQIAEMRPGQRARVSVDAYSGHDLYGHVDSLAGGTGSRFSLLPPDNASGNFTKVVQRVPVLVRLDPHPSYVLRPGMSVSVSVTTE